MGNNKLASGSSDKTLKIWEIESGECLKTLLGHTAEVYALQYFGNNQLASGSLDTTIKIWDLETGACLKTLEHGDTSDVYSILVLSNNNNSQLDLSNLRI